MRIELNEISDYEYINRKMREHAQELLKTAKKQKRPIRYLPQGISGNNVTWCKQHHWQPPAFRYEPETLELLWQDSTAQWLPLAVHPLYQAEVNGK